MSAYTVNKLVFNFGFLLEGSPGQSSDIELDYPGVLLQDVLLAPLQGAFHASRTAQGIFVKGELTSRAPAVCARCNSDFLQPLVMPLDDHFYTPHFAPEGEYVVRDDGVLDLGPLVRELSVLAVPIQPVCRPDCKGLCSECGANLNEGECGCDRSAVDPRLSILRSFLDQHTDRPR